MRIDALQRYQRRHRQGRFNGLPYGLRVEAERILRRLCARRQGNVPRWLFAILCGRAKWLALHPPDHDWGKRMLAKRAGYARQRQCRALGIHPTARATAARLARRKRVGLRDQPSIANGTNQDRYRIRTAADVTYASYVRFGR